MEYSEIIKYIAKIGNYNIKMNEIHPKEDSPELKIIIPFGDTGIGYIKWYSEDKVYTIDCFDLKNPDFQQSKQAKLLNELLETRAYPTLEVMKKYKIKVEVSNI